MKQKLEVKEAQSPTTIKCPYVNKHKFCPKCGLENPRNCGLEVAGPSPISEEPVVETPTVTPQAETLTFTKPKGRGRRG